MLRERHELYENEELPDSEFRIELRFERLDTLGEGTECKELAEFGISESDCRSTGTDGLLKIIPNFFCWRRSSAMASFCFVIFSIIPTRTS